MTNELAYQIALSLLPGVGNQGIKQLISYSGSASRVFESSKSQLLRIPGVGDKLAETIVQNRSIKQAERVLEDANAIGANVISYHDQDFPSRLKHIIDAPNVLFMKGQGDLNPKRSIAIVGTRKATNYGRRIVEKLIAELANLNVTIVSGLAYGIDIQAHRSCLKHGIPTFGVLAGGLDKLYPSSHKKYAEEMMNRGGILSESIPGTKPDPHLFPIRNRIIAGMTDATLVVEAAAKGGALITAHLADSYNRPVFAVPGDLGSPYSEGTNALIASQRALILTGVEDLAFHLNWDLSPSAGEPLQLPELTAQEDNVYGLLKEAGKPMEIDLIAIKTQIPINQIASLLLSLEFKNIVKSLPGKKYGIA